MDKYFLYSHLRNSFHSLRKTTRENLYLSFNRVYILSLLVFIILGVLYVWTLNITANSGYQINSIENERREKNQEMLFLRSQVAKQISPYEITKYDDKTEKIFQTDIRYITYDQ